MYISNIANKIKHAPGDPHNKENLEEVSIHPTKAQEQGVADIWQVWGKLHIVSKPHIKI